MPRVLLVPSLRLEGWKAMDRYAAALARELPSLLPRDWSVAVHPHDGYPGWSRFAARWLMYPRTVDWSRYDIVHVLDHSYAHLLKRRSHRARTVVTVHDLYAFTPLASRPGLRGATVARINGWVLDGLNRADICLCDSEATRASVVARYPAIERRARCQMLGVDGEFFSRDTAELRTQGRALLGVAPGERLAVHVGSCVARKNVDGLLRGFADLRPRENRLRLVQVGGRFTTEQRATIAALGLDTVVSQRSHVTDDILRAFYNAADVIVVPSLFEGFGLPVLEAFAAGTPVVSTRNGALGEFPASLLENAGSGSAAELAAAMRTVLAAPDVARSRAVDARAWARQFTWPAVVRPIADLYTSLV